MELYEKVKGSWFNLILISLIAVLLGLITFAIPIYYPFFMGILFMYNTIKSQKKFMVENGILVEDTVVKID